MKLPEHDPNVASARGAGDALEGPYFPQSGSVAGLPTRLAV